MVWCDNHWAFLHLYNHKKCHHSCYHNVLLAESEPVERLAIKNSNWRLQHQPGYFWLRNPARVCLSAQTVHRVPKMWKQGDASILNHHPQSQTVEGNWVWFEFVPGVWPAKCQCFVSDSNFLLLRRQHPGEGQEFEAKKTWGTDWSAIQINFQDWKW